jgi:hypothetical protein
MAALNPPRAATRRRPNAASLTHGWREREPRRNTFQGLARRGVQRMVEIGVRGHGASHRWGRFRRGCQPHAMRCQRAHQRQPAKSSAHQVGAAQRHGFTVGVAARWCLLVHGCDGQHRLQRADQRQQHGIEGSGPCVRPQRLRGAGVQQRCQCIGQRQGSLTRPQAWQVRTKGTGRRKGAPQGHCRARHDKRHHRRLQSDAAGRFAQPTVNDQAVAQHKRQHRRRGVQGA